MSDDPQTRRPDDLLTRLRTEAERTRRLFGPSIVALLLDEAADALFDALLAVDRSLRPQGEDEIEALLKTIGRDYNEPLVERIRWLVLDHEKRGELLEKANAQLRRRGRDEAEAAREDGIPPPDYRKLAIALLEEIPDYLGMTPDPWPNDEELSAMRPHTARLVNDIASLLERAGSAIPPEGCGEAGHPLTCNCYPDPPLAGDATGDERRPSTHVHSRDCDCVATIVYRENGEEKSWSVGAMGCADTQLTMRQHLAKWKPEATFVSVKIESVE